MAHRSAVLRLLAFKAFDRDHVAAHLPTGSRLRLFKARGERATLLRGLLLDTSSLARFALSIGGSSGGFHRCFCLGSQLLNLLYGGRHPFLERLLPFSPHTY